MANDLTHAKLNIQAAAGLIVDSILALLQQDPHQWSARPCSTCRAITSLRGSEFGCYLYAKEKQEQ